MKFTTIALAPLVLTLASVASAQTLPSNDAATSFPSALTSVAPGNGSYLAQFPQLGVTQSAEAGLATNAGCLGVEAAWGNVWVSARGPTGVGSHVIGQFDPNGVLINSTLQQNTGATAWGIRDLESDEAANKLWGGQEGSQLQEYDRIAGAPDTLAFAVVHTITGAPAGTVRALCRDNTGTFYTASFNTAILKFTINPFVVVATLPGNATNHYGFAYDRINDTIWTFCQDNINIVPPPGAGLDTVEFREFDKNTGALITVGNWGLLHAVAAQNLAGGMDIYEDNVLNPNKLSIIALHQYAIDEINRYDLGKFTQPQPVTYCTAKVNSQGCSPAIGSSGQSSATASSGFLLTASLELNNKVGLVLYSEFGRDAAAFGPGGLLCVKAPTRRSKGFNSGGTPPPTADCTGVFSIDFNTFGRGLLGTPPNPAAYLSIPGQVVTAQFWGRDPGIPVPNNFSLSNGIEFTVGP